MGLMFMLFIWILGLASWGYLGMLYFPGVLLPALNALGIITFFWVMEEFFDKKERHDVVSTVLRVLYLICIANIWWSLATQTKIYAETGVLNLNPALTTPALFFPYIIKWLGTTLLAAWLLYYVLYEWGAMFIHWWKHSDDKLEGDYGNQVW